MGANGVWLQLAGPLAGTLRLRSPLQPPGEPFKQQARGEACPISAMVAVQRQKVGRSRRIQRAGLSASHPPVPGAATAPAAWRVDPLTAGGCGALECAS